MRNSFIYTLTDPITNKIRYVGKTDLVSFDSFAPSLF